MLMTIASAVLSCERCIPRTPCAAGRTIVLNDRQWQHSSEWRWPWPASRIVVLGSRAKFLGRSNGIKSSPLTAHICPAPRLHRSNRERRRVSSLRRRSADLPPGEADRLLSLRGSQPVAGPMSCDQLCAAGSGRLGALEAPGCLSRSDSPRSARSVLRSGDHAPPGRYMTEGHQRHSRGDDQPDPQPERGSRVAGAVSECAADAREYHHDQIVDRPEPSHSNG